MNIHSVDELRPLLNKTTAQLIVKTFDFCNINYKLLSHININELHSQGMKIAEMNNLNTETTLLLYTLPPDYDSEKDIPEHILLKEMNDFGKLNHTKCLCIFIENMTLEILAAKINQVSSMKAFL
jgi:hypothetical protein